MRELLSGGFASDGNLITRNPRLAQIAQLGWSQADLYSLRTTPRLGGARQTGCGYALESWRRGRIRYRRKTSYFFLALPFSR